MSDTREYGHCWQCDCYLPMELMTPSVNQGEPVLICRYCLNDDPDQTPLEHGDDPDLGLDPKNVKEYPT